MTTYLLESGLSLLVLLGLYKLLLENQPMHRLKRAYLLGTLIVSLVAPLITVDVPMSTLQVVDIFLTQPIDREAINKLTNTPKQPAFASESISIGGSEPINYWLGFYAAGTVLMLIRFGRNLCRLTRQIGMNPTQRFRGATLVRLPGAGLPYTFLHYLFVPDAAYQRGEIEGELFTHELAHVRQRHSLDVLLVELLLCFGWFNPLLFWLKRAMQLNHEFLADEAVNNTYRNVSGYQELLFSKLSYSSPVISIISTFTFQTTKQRLTMMTKHASPVRIWLVAGATVLLLSTTTMLLSSRTVAQKAPAVPAIKQGTPQSTLTDKQLFDKNMTTADKERLFSDKPVHEAIEPGTKKLAERRFKDLTSEEKTRVIYLPPSSRNTPTEAQWADFKNTKKYGIWVDDKRRRDNPMSKYNRTDIVHFLYSFVHKNARQPEGYLYQLGLYTEEGYQKELRESEERPNLFLVTKEQIEKRRKARSGK